MITAQMVKELRERTGAGMMNCKKALTEAEGDMEKAIEVLREKGLAAAAKKAGRIAAEGLIVAYMSQDNKKGAIVEVNCETDFVSKNQEFIDFANKVAKQVVETDVNTVEELVATSIDGVAIDDLVKALIAKIGENVAIRRFDKFKNDNGVINYYIHGERMGVMVHLASEKADSNKELLMEVAKELALQAAAMSPICVSSDEIPTEKVEQEKEIYRTQALEEGKPANVVEKMVVGRVKKYYKEVCLLEQTWVKDSDKSIKDYLADESKKIGAEIKVESFVRYEKGEGIEKKEDNFVEEVMKQMGK